MRKSLGDDEDHGTEMPTIVRDRRRPARCVPDRLDNAGPPEGKTAPDSNRDSNNTRQRRTSAVANSQGRSHVMRQLGICSA